MPPAQDHGIPFSTAAHLSLLLPQSISCCAPVAHLCLIIRCTCCCTPMATQAARNGDLPSVLEYARLLGQAGSSAADQRHHRHPQQQQEAAAAVMPGAEGGNTAAEWLAGALQVCTHCGRVRVECVCMSMRACWCMRARGCMRMLLSRRPSMCGLPVSNPFSPPPPLRFVPFVLAPTGQGIQCSALGAATARRCTAGAVAAALAATRRRGGRATAGQEPGGSAGVAAGSRAFTYFFCALCVSIPGFYGAGACRMQAQWGEGVRNINTPCVNVRH